MFKIDCSRSTKQHIIIDWQETEEKQRLIIVPNFNENIQKRSYNWMLKVSTWNCNGLFMSLLEVSTRKPIIVFYYKTTESFVSRTMWKKPFKV